jgi:hypothetical protein
MLNALLPLVSAALSIGGDPPIVVTAPRTAQVQLAVTLSEADAIHAVTARSGSIVFAIDRDGEAYEIVATTRKRAVIGLTITDVGPAIGTIGGLTWLGAELADVTAVTALSADGDGAVTITTNDGRAYMAIPGRGSGGNAAASARWAAAWNQSDS